MTVIKKSDLATLTATERNTKIAELEKAILELHGEGRGDKVKALRKAIAKLKTPQKVKKG